MTGEYQNEGKKLYGTIDDDPSLTAPCIGGAYGQAEDYTVNVLTSSLATHEVTKKNASFRVYPNPVTQILNIDSQEKIQSVSVFDATGRNVLSSEVNQAKYNVDLSKLTSGTYIVTIKTESGSQSAKVIKK
ncbi:T9SS type A sorting domain-containing protein [Chryseobacterium arthrosphaerae]|uniref:T9SS type A sorting domain-containing protein n=1 Tax=Chryseobacterium arthrosphaerae TaxID=651561 RepID=A0A3S0QTW5_9FLAO|nr:T9SS type A sorting domain-containing protein [Chryseobacterium arthrosphaerae]